MSSAVILIFGLLLAPSARSATHSSDSRETDRADRRQIAASRALDARDADGGELQTPINEQQTPEETAPESNDVALVPFRTKIREPGAYLLRRGEGRDDSVGLLVSAVIQPDRVAQSLRPLFDGGEPGAKRELFVTGVPMGSERSYSRSLRRAVADAALDAGGLRINVLSAPRPREAGWRYWADRVRYFLPSLRRDYQRPLLAEILSGALTTALVELPNAAYLLTALPSPDVWIVLSIHALVCGLYITYMRSMANWCLRAQGGAELFLKLTCTALPFVVNYNLFGNFSWLAAFAAAHGPAALAGLLPHALAAFLLSQGLTMVLQTVFYGWIVMKAFRGWAASQKTPADAEAARTWVNVLLMPWLWLDAIFLAQAGLTTHALFAAGPFVLTSGHLYLALLTLAGAAFAAKPRLLDASLRWYRRLGNSRPEP